MSEFLLPAIFAVAGLIAALVTYRGIRRGGARYYTLEREALLRRASFTLLLSVLFFVVAVGVLVYRQNQIAAPGSPEEGNTENVAQATITPTLTLEQFPPTATATPDAPAITPTATQVICRAIVDGTSGNGLTLRSEPSGDEITVLADGSVLIVLEDEAVESGGFSWRKVRLVGGEEGWVAEDFLTVRAPCN